MQKYMFLEEQLATCQARMTTQMSALLERIAKVEQQTYCQTLNAHLVVITDNIENEYIKKLIHDSKTANYLWVGMKTKASPSDNPNLFSNFDGNNPIDGCAGGLNKHYLESKLSKLPI
ncbi:hypothetical protein WR25_24980 [Diploscapter pachys]|uniref:C-type lectin domain-containing protein n=1 Tax=Diploscapter pachys TaxID=2018661 RepID=A0A2A2LA35_9BILA|nr:hypothetical protein WR25_24980 [Diploscapter pachys]